MSLTYFNYSLILTFQTIISCANHIEVPSSTLQSTVYPINRRSLHYKSRSEQQNDDNGDDQHGGITLFQFIRSPEPDSYESGYRRGSTTHLIERNDKKVGNQGKVKVRWSDQQGQGSQTWEFGKNQEEEKEMDKIIGIINFYSGSTKKSN